jgi:hypothetical protein
MSSLIDSRLRINREHWQGKRDDFRTPQVFRTRSDDQVTAFAVSGNGSEYRCGKSLDRVRRDLGNDQLW